MRLTDRDEAILRALSQSVRLLALDQIARCWWPEAKNPQESASKRLRALTRSDHVMRCSVFAKRLTDLSSPIASWQPGESEARWAQVSHQLQSRWSMPARKWLVFIAGKKSANRFVSRARNRLIRPFQMSHDLGVSDVFVSYFLNQSEVLPQWWGEDHYQTSRQKIPDAILAESPQSPPKRIIEFGGSYSAERLRAFHKGHLQNGNYCNVGYEIW